MSKLSRSARQRLSLCFLCLCLLVWKTAAASQNLVTLLPGQNLALDSHFDLLIDPDGKLSLSDVSRPDAHFEPSTGRDTLHFGYTQDVVWLRVKLRASDWQRDTLDWILHFQYAYLDNIEVFIVRHDGIEHMHSGYAEDPKLRPLIDPYPAFPIQLKSGEQVTVYVRAQIVGSMTLDARITPMPLFHVGSGKRLLIQAIFIGMVIGLGVYNLFLGIVLRQRAFLYYCLFVFAFGFTTESSVGVIPAYLYPLVESFVLYVVPVGYTLSVALALMFARCFLSLERNLPKLDWVMKIVMLICFVLAVVIMALPAQIGVKIMSAVGLSVSILLLIAGTIGIYHRIPAARYFMLAWLGLMVGTALVSVRNEGWLPSNFWTVHGLQLGSFADMVLLSFGLASRFNELKKRQVATQHELVSTLKNQEQLLAQRVLERTDELENSNQRLEQLVMKDALTGALNRYGLQMMIQRSQDLVGRERMQVGVIVIDLDGFKPINDRYGHLIGDEVLKVVARRLRNTVRTDDTVARYGGDEFVLLCNGCTGREELLQFGQRLKMHIEEPIHLEDGRQVVVGASIGLAISEDEPVNVGELLQRADHAMYEIKRHLKGEVGIDG